MFPWALSHPNFVQTDKKAVVFVQKLLTLLAGLVSSGSTRPKVPQSHRNWFSCQGRGLWKCKVNVFDSNAKGILLAASVNALMALFFVASCDWNVCLFDSASCYKVEKLPPLVSMGASGDTPSFPSCFVPNDVWVAASGAVLQQSGCLLHQPQRSAVQPLMNALRRTTRVSEAG